MLLHEIFSLFGSIDLLLSEGFKDDMFKQYPEDVENKDFKAAITAYNSDPKLKEALKHAVKPQGNIAVSIKRRYPTAVDFVNLIKSLTDTAKEKEEYKQIKQGTASVGETDYWLIPCHTFKEAHEAAFKYAGNLPRLTKEEITNKYGIVTPKPATYYETDKTPAEFLEYMKNEDRFFMAPSWCVAADDYYFTERYNLETSEDETPLCYVFISKKYPNVRFCIALIRNNKQSHNIFYENEKMKITYDVDLNEVRDPWQIGGGISPKETGLKMMRLAFGNKINKVIKDICSIKTKIISFSKLKNGKEFFSKVNNVPSISGSFDKLTKRREYVFIF